MKIVGLLVLVALCCVLTHARIELDDVPASFQVAFNTTKGPIIMQVVKAWAPLGVARFYELLQSQYYDNNAFFRVIPNFVAQWGINSDPSISQKWENSDIPNDPVIKSNTRGFVTYAAAYVNGTTCCRTTQLYVNTRDNSRLDSMGFAPFAQVINAEGMTAVDKFYGGYGESVDQDTLYSQGAAYLKQFPLLDYINTARIVSTEKEH